MELLVELVRVVHECLVSGWSVFNGWMVNWWSVTSQCTTDQWVVSIWFAVVKAHWLGSKWGQRMVRG